MLLIVRLVFLLLVIDSKMALRGSICHAICCRRINSTAWMSIELLVAQCMKHVSVCLLYWFILILFSIAVAWLTCLAWVGSGIIYWPPCLAHYCFPARPTVGEIVNSGHIFFLTDLFMSSQCDCRLGWGYRVGRSVFWWSWPVSQQSYCRWDYLLYQSLILVAHLSSVI